jgi:hypothetical protein
LISFGVNCTKLPGTEVGLPSSVFGGCTGLATGKAHSGRAAPNVAVTDNMSADKIRIVFNFYACLAKISYKFSTTENYR